MLQKNEWSSSSHLTKPPPSLNECSSIVQHQLHPPNSIYTTFAFFSIYPSYMVKHYYTAFSSPFSRNLSPICILLTISPSPSRCPLFRISKRCRAMISYAYFTFLDPKVLSHTVGRKCRKLFFIWSLRWKSRKMSGLKYWIYKLKCVRM